MVMPPFGPTRRQRIATSCSYLLIAHILRRCGLVLLLPPERHLLARVSNLLPVVVRVDTVMVLTLACGGHN